MVKNNLIYMTDFDSIFDEKWYKSITDAALYVFSKLNLSEDAKNKIALEIIDYNIEKKLNEVALSSMLNLLPTTLNWQKKDSIDIFNEFKSIIDICNACPTFNEHKIKILLPKDRNLFTLFNEWQASVNEFYPQFKLTITKTLNPRAVYLKILKNY